MRTIEAAPRASLLIESMRDIGYSLETAVADVIDNSITAGAGNIELLTAHDGDNGAIGILDDGHGMTQAELLDAMRIGSRDPREPRPAMDLGRFGLGLKTASFSQCRRLTVVTRRDGASSCARWDLDYVAEKDDWLVQLPDDPLTVPWAERIDEQGTLVVWEKLDRLVEKSDHADQKHFTARVNDTCSHLELVFHRFLSGEPGRRRISMSVNGRRLEPFDPFFENHTATITGPEERIRLGGHDVVVQSFTLPHHKHVSPKQWERQAGPGGYLKNQGFYIYRERRLILRGTWFGLALQSELTRLARVRVDVPSALDAKWRIDVKKASAQPPRQVKERLRKIASRITTPSKRVYRSRGAKLVDEKRMPLWQRIRDKEQIHYCVNGDHPAIENFRTRLPDDLAGEFDSLLELVGTTVPVDTLFADFGADPEKTGAEPISDDALKCTAQMTFDQLGKTIPDREKILEVMRSAEPFQSNWERTLKSLDGRTPQAGG